jgi:voltage-gated potassium channel
MAQNNEELGKRISHDGWFSGVLFSATVMLLVSVGVTEGFGWLTLVVLGAVLSAAGTFLWMFPGSRFFVLSFANSLALYATAFFFLSIANFPNAHSWVFGIGYLLPIYFFLIGVWRHREAILEMSEREEFKQATLSGRGVLWIVPIIFLSGLTFAVPEVELHRNWESAVLLGFAAVIAVFALLDSRQICLFLLDTGLLFDQLFARVGRLFRPAFAFFTLYSFLVIVFAMIYRIMDRLSGGNSFLFEGEPAAISFSESLYFSLITMSTVGYGDITPASEAVRAITAVEIMLGILLILFGFAEIIRYARDPDAEGKSDK